ncbi:MAG: glycosyltransferase family 2 protein [Verrucomicrobiota bacterium]
MSNPDISVVVPLHNEGLNVLPLARQVFEALKNETRGVELILVDDASKDDTWERVQDAARSEPRVRGLQHGRQAGQSAALWTGFRASRGSIILTLDGDLQNDPADLPKLMAELANYDVVCGWRMKRMDNGLRKISTWVARRARKWSLNSEFQDTGCNLRAFRKSVLELLPSFNGFHRFMPILAQGAGVRVKEIPVNHHPRAAGKSNYGLWNRLGRGIYDLLGVRWYLKRQIKRIEITELKRPS